uniref:Fucosyltransferase n=1 Tax=Parastrongyloides trichosuri TaxID=131310 RepID=A0A0N4Z8E3_PARTI
MNTKYKFLIILLILSFTYIYISFLDKINDTLTEYKNRFFEPSYRLKKRILLYTKVFGQSSDWTVKGCEELNCELTEDKSLFSTSDAVVFHHADLGGIYNYPTRSFEKQKFVFYSLESPFLVRSFGPQNYFNWIMSYNDKADITFTYGSKWRKCNKICNHLPYNSSKILSAKTNRGIIGYISNCKTNSARLKIINALRKYVPIVFYGECALSNEPKEACKKFDYECERVVINSYYFFIAFENALCDNYITEKYWARYSFDSIPIVIKRDIYENLNIPSSSFIAVDDFKSAKEMGDYLNYLMNNTKEYLKYFEYRKQNIEVMDEKEYHLMNGFCNLCKKLYENDKSNDVIKNVSINYLNINRCISKKDSDKFSDLW